ncbi:hypothetical protein GQ43DRAFT_438452 [Delitschia confertaspora ATCC 74209]|uniref:Mpv17 / PMP22 family protein n=1 Tax=Delitschia confertaspora ATCC 74209 TaxID=1513339 RepID=A0A9P4JSY9_9PLEO|nr:hypothetical protein GQ43DRAFT_438452 [Delitschia confertaspora ATCC 74209]
MSMISQTIQGALLSVVSNILAQLIAPLKNGGSFTFNPVPVIKFFVYALINNPPNILWQSFLEDKFPTEVLAPKSEKNDGKPTKTTSVTNILTKFALDQSFGAAINTAMFLAFMAYTDTSKSGQYQSWDAVKMEVNDKFHPMIMDSYKLWPLFSLISFIWIPVEKRVVAGATVGILWGVYLSLAVGS